MDEEKRQEAGKKFLDFTILFFTVAKGMYRHENMIKANSLAFQTLMDLNHLEPEKSWLTMSELADNLRITKQQLTKLVNDLEEKQLVERFHDKTNRRLVNISITPHGRQLLSQLRKEMLATTLQSISNLNAEEVDCLDSTLTSLNRLMEKLEKCSGSSRNFHRNLHAPTADAPVNS